MKSKHPMHAHPLTEVLIEAREFLIGELAAVDQMIQFLNDRRAAAPGKVAKVVKAAPAKAAAKPAKVAKSTKPPKRTFSPAAKKRMSAGMREFWKRRKAAQTAKGKAKLAARRKPAPKAPIAPPASAQPAGAPHAEVSGSVGAAEV